MRQKWAALSPLLFGRTGVFFSMAARFEPLVLLVYQSGAGERPLMRLCEAIEVGAPRTKGRIDEHVIDSDDHDTDAILRELRHRIELAPTLRVVMLCLASVQDPTTRRMVNIAAEMAPVLSKDKMLRVYVCGRPSQCVLYGAGDSVTLPDAPTDPVYDVPKLTLGVTGPVQKIICEKMNAWLTPSPDPGRPGNAPVTARKTGERKLTDLGWFTPLS